MSLNFKDDQELENFLKNNTPTAPNTHSVNQKDEFKNILLNVHQYKRSTRNKTIGAFSGVLVVMFCLIIVVFPTNKGVTLTKTIAPKTTTAVAIPGNANTSNGNEIVEEDENSYYPAINVGSEYFSMLGDKI